MGPLSCKVIHVFKSIWLLWLSPLLGGLRRLCILYSIFTGSSTVKSSPSGPQSLFLESDGTSHFQGHGLKCSWCYYYRWDLSAHFPHLLQLFLHLLVLIFVHSSLQWQLELPDLWQRPFSAACWSQLRLLSEQGRWLGLWRYLLWLASWTHWGSSIL